MYIEFLLNEIIGGIDQHVDSAILHAAFIPFGEIVAVQLSPDASKGTLISVYRTEKVINIVNFS
jgi:hypothetical protein